MNTEQAKQKRYKIVNIHRNFKRNSKYEDLKNFVYAELRDEDDNLEISGSLYYILEEIINRGYLLEGDIL